MPVHSLLHKNGHVLTRTFKHLHVEYCNPPLPPHAHTHTRTHTHTRIHVHVHVHPFFTCSHFLPPALTITRTNTNVHLRLSFRFGRGSRASVENPSARTFRSTQVRTHFKFFHIDRFFYGDYSVLKGLSSQT